MSDRPTLLIGAPCNDLPVRWISADYGQDVNRPDYLAPVIFVASDEPNGDIDQQIREGCSADLSRSHGEATIESCRNRPFFYKEGFSFLQAIEVVRISICCGAPHLEAAQRLLCEDNRKTTGGHASVIQRLLEVHHCFLRLNIHVAYVDQRVVLVRSTTKRPVRFISRGNKPRDVGRREEAPKLDADQIAYRVYPDVKISNHSDLLASARFPNRLRRDRLSPLSGVDGVFNRSMQAGVN